MYLATSLFYFFALGMLLTRSVSWDDLQVNSPEVAELEAVRVDSLLHHAELPDSILDQLPMVEQTDSVPAITSMDGLIDLLKDPEIGDEELLDSLDLEPSAGNYKLVGQLRKVARKELDVFIPFLLQNVPIMMLLLLPIFALILKLLYVRRNILYVKHLVHGLYLHSFAYLIYGGAIFLITLAGFSESGNNWVGALSFLGVAVYSFISFLKVYQQGWFRTLAKFGLAGCLYFTVLLIFSLGEFMISFWLF